MSTESVSPESFDPLIFWLEHKRKILIYTAVVVAALLGYGISSLVSQTRAKDSAELLAKAKTVQDYQAVAQKYSGTNVGGDAMLIVADKLRAEKKYDEAVSTLRDFIAKQPNHPLAAGAWTSLGATFEFQNKLDEALDAYQQAITLHSESYTTPIAMMAQARINASKGKTEDAQRGYQDVMARFGDTMYAREAARELKFLRK